jgi:hypothetical protein
MTTSLSPEPHSHRPVKPFWRTELEQMARLGTPIVLTQLAWVAMLTTDTAMIGRLGPDALAGASLSLMIFFLTWVFLLWRRHGHCRTRISGLWRAETQDGPSRDPSGLLGHHNPYSAGDGSVPLYA